MNFRFRIALLLASVIVLGFILLRHFEPIHNRQQQPSPVAVGAILPLSGDGASYGKSMQRGMELYLAQQEGRAKIRFLYEDSRLDTMAAVSALQKLIAADQVPVVAGFFTSSQMLAAAPVAESSRVVAISATATAQKIRDAGEYIFRIIPDDTFDGKMVANLVNKYMPEKRSVSVVYLDNDYGIGIVDSFVSQNQRLGQTIVAKVPYPKDTSDFRVIISKLKSMDQPPDVLFLVGYKEMGYFLRQASELGFSPTIVSTGLAEDPEIVKLAGKGAEGVMYTYPSFDPAVSQGTTAEFVTAFKAKYSEEPDVIAALGYDLAGVIAVAVTGLSSIDGPSVRARMSSIKNFPGVAGEFSFDRHGDVVKPAGIKVIKDGRFVWLDHALAAE